MEQTDTNKPEFNSLNEFAKSTGRILEFKEQMYNSSRPNRYPKYRNEAYIPYNSDASSYFVCLYDSMFREGEFSVFSGTFIPVALPLTSNFSIRKRTIFDSINSVFGKKDFKTGNKKFDAKVVASGNDNHIMKIYLSNTNFQDNVLKALEIKPTIQISLNDINVSFVPGLENKSQFCIYDRQEWVLDKMQIENLFSLIEDFRKLIKKI
ncbi:MAG: hypothetical protein PHE33_08150 [Bacteroidales bacterium]|nr:hypothetical protein [Bacteroidales bacterium]